MSRVEQEVTRRVKRSQPPSRKPKSTGPLLNSEGVPITPDNFPLSYKPSYLDGYSWPVVTTRPLPVTEQLSLLAEAPATEEATD